MTESLPRLIALDIDGTIMRHDGTISRSVAQQIRRLDLEGHHVVLTTGRSWATTLPVLELLAVSPEFVICSNGGVTLRRRSGARGGYSRHRVQTFDPSTVITSIRAQLPDADIAVEDHAGEYRYTAAFPEATTGPIADQTIVTTAELRARDAVRVVAIDPGRPLDDFLDAVERMKLRGVRYTLGWTAWLDVAAEGVTKASAIERVRHQLGVPRGRVLAVGDGHNDLELLAWAAKHGRGVAMGHAPRELIALASEVTQSIHDDGLASVLAGL
jgi:Cof subfamily protein (haloacid dehalogenase superfamily)